MKNMKLLITHSDVKQAKGYHDTCNCLVGTVLSRNGYTSVKASGYDVLTDQGNFKIVNSKFVLHAYYDDPTYGDLQQKVNPRVIGHYIELEAI